MRRSIIFAALLGILLMAIIPQSAWACPSCYGAISDTEIAQGLQLAMLALIGAISTVGVGVVLFFSNIKKRSAMYAAGDQNIQSTE